MTTPITVTLTAYNMGPNTKEEDFDAWHAFVCNRIDKVADIIYVGVVGQHSFAAGPAEDTITGGTEEQREAIRPWLAHEWWDDFCAEQDARAGAVDGVRY